MLSSCYNYFCVNIYWREIHVLSNSEVWCFGFFLNFFLCVSLPGDSKSWESPDEADNVWQLFIQILFRTFHQVSEKTSQQTYSHQKTTWKAFQMPPRAIKHQLTCPISFLIRRRGIFVIPRNRLVRFSKYFQTSASNNSKEFYTLSV